MIKHDQTMAMENLSFIIYRCSQLETSISIGISIATVAYGSVSGDRTKIGGWAMLNNPSENNSLKDENLTVT